ncbi:hypothetical protein VIGAN_04210400 [Vigna angularis var. angularis]|uniref:Uncharacterized protein n=1 Tax=Vigna angularis var. angularis TaxID=157739 RepID=A0A0S3RVV2_PHAAN|nr:hypothetical protein VIGAN_04210400 [Vigna angularis var. angularis]
MIMRLRKMVMARAGGGRIAVDAIRDSMLLQWRSFCIFAIFGSLGLMMNARMKMLPWLTSCPCGGGLNDAAAARKGSSGWRQSQ